MEPISVGAPARRLLAGCVLRTQTDERLVRLYRDGHESAFEEIDRRYRSRLCAYAGSFVGPDRAEDVLQDAFARATRALRADDREIELGPWLFRIVRNGALNALRDAPPRHAQLDEAMDGVEQPADAVLRREQLEETVAAVRRLPQSQREALVRREMEGQSLTQIGSTMGVSSGAVGLLIFRARTALREGCGLLLPVGLVRLILGYGGAAGAAGGAGIGGAALGKGLATLAISGAAITGGVVWEARDGGAPPRQVTAAADQSAEGTRTAAAAATRGEAFAPANSAPTSVLRALARGGVGQVSDTEAGGLGAVRSTLSSDGNTEAAGTQSGPAPAPAEGPFRPPPREEPAPHGLTGGGGPQHTYGPGPGGDGVFDGGPGPETRQPPPEGHGDGRDQPYAGSPQPVAEPEPAPLITQPGPYGPRATGGTFPPPPVDGTRPPRQP